MEQLEHRTDKPEKTFFRTKLLRFVKEGCHRKQIFYQMYLVYK